MRVFVLRNPRGNETFPSAVLASARMGEGKEEARRDPRADRGQKKKEERHAVDALAPSAEEGRGQLR
jgi:hypothetical protein